MQLIYRLLDDLLQRDEAGRVGGSNTGTTVTDGSVRNGELSEVEADHLHLNIYHVEHLAVVHSHGGADHLGGDDHISQVGLDDRGSVKRTASCRI